MHAYIHKQKKTETLALPRIKFYFISHIQTTEHW